MTTALHLTEEQAQRLGTAGGQAPEDRPHAVCRLGDLEPLWGEAALVDGAQVALIRVPGDHVYAVSQWDPVAKAHVMARGIVGTKGGRPTLASPIHKQVYDLETGRCLSEDGFALSVFAVAVDAEGLVHVTA
ncbi:MULTISPECIES: nitrite reductase small subunit NirD [Nesterenkonia]|uniref:NAD(P)H-dependent nitrite reductase small subunit n=1 Tax=Nesterenkonia xinjiangensis TaxID=225327 RepID=A0A7Z0GM65_9MICC|nr:MULTISPECIES: nitrite reductase small subunit NirD [Nesterenkonia]MDZ5077589.1 nitrite reductase small subunit NirD [Nesterenkonia sp. HG001]NYJ78539.1 NAD(P)H-dependent nitrite reductase small subunit [Nesterenkonia xinjiangensis]